MIDTHAHIYLPEFDSDRPNIIESARENGIEKILMPAIDSSTHSVMLDVEKEYPDCLSMIGLHPCSVNDEFENELKIIDDYLLQRKFIAIGEIGLDFYWDKTFTAQQYKAFHAQIEIALKYNLPIAIHSRNAIDECIEAVREYPELTGVFHCFSGSVDQALAIINTGFMLGIGGVISFKNAGLDTVIEQIGIENVILETDAPYLAPVPFRGKRNEPAYTKIVAEKLAQVTGHNLDVIEQLTTRNVLKLFKL
jgi:TatD DNase family protein